MSDHEVHLEAQGSLVAIAVNHFASSPVGGGRRGAVTHFSKASRRRLLRKLARLEATRPIFVTLTYPAVFPDPKTAKGHLRAFLERIRRRWPEGSAIWRLELQERGAPHFHLLFYGIPFIPFADIRAWWGAIIGVGPDDPLFVRVERVRSKRGAMYYASKYLAKADDQPAAGALFNSDAYLHAGRWWGVFNSGFLPFAAKVYLVLAGCRWRSLADAKRWLRRIGHRATKSRAKGAVFFDDKAYHVAASLLRLLTDDFVDERWENQSWSRYILESRNINSTSCTWVGTGKQWYERSIKDNSPMPQSMATDYSGTTYQPVE